MSLESSTIDKSESSSFEDLATAAANEIEEAKLAEPAIKEVFDESKASPQKCDWDDVLGSGDLLRKIVNEGDESEGLRPQRNDVCSISYEIRLRDGSQTLIEKRENVKIYAGDNELLQGMDLVLTLMYKNEKCELQMAPRFAYGERGLAEGESLGYVYDDKETFKGPSFGSDAWITAQLELHDFDEEPEHETLAITERMEIGTRRRLRGNWWYSRGESQLALQLYRRSLDVLDESKGGISDPTPSGDPDLASEALCNLLSERACVYNNMAAAHAQLGAHQAAVQAAERALELQPKNAKALYRKARGLWELGNLEDALAACEEATEAAPEQSAPARLLARIQQQTRKARTTERELARRMLGQSADPKPDKPPSNKVWIWGSLILSLLVAVGSVIVYRYKMNDPAH